MGADLREIFWVGLASCTAGLVLAGCGQDQMAQICAPEGAPSALSTAAIQETGPVTAYWDGSESLAGYVDGAEGNLHPLADIQRLIQDHGRDTGADINWLRFGSRISAMPAKANPAQTAFYRCGGTAVCDNQESRLDDVLNQIAEDTAPGLRIIVSDLWLSTSAFQGSTEVALGGPMRRILAGKNGQAPRSIAVIGLRAPYQGPIYEVPGIGTHRGARERPLFVVLIGSRREILSAYRALIEARSPAFADERVRFSWFGPEPANDWLGDMRNVKLTGSTLPAPVFSAPEMPLLQVEASLADLKSGRAGLSLDVDPAKSIIPGAVWEGAPSGFTRVWRRASTGCGAGAWEAAPPLRGAWRPFETEDGRPSARFVLDQGSAADLLPGHTYLISGSYTTRTVNPNSEAAKWMREWGVSPENAPALARRNPSFFPALNLAELAEILEKGTQAQQPEGGRPLGSLAFVLKTTA